MEHKLICLLIGYLAGCILTAEIVVRVLTGKPARELGTTGNPGMANVMANLGFVPGIIVLAGDLGKTIVAAIICIYIFPDLTTRQAVMYAALGATLGHDFPFWQKFRGGKGVATGCIGYLMIAPLSGIVSLLCGFACVLVSKYLNLGGMIIPVVFTALMFIFVGQEAGLVGCVFSLIALYKNWKSLVRIAQGTEEKVDVAAALKKKLAKGRTSDRDDAAA